jgi:predicted acetyltransferase
MTEGAIITKVAMVERDVLWRYLQFYIYDMSRFTDARPVDGVFAYRHFDAYWREGERRSALWAHYDGDTAGFALVRFDMADNHHEVAEFFVLKRFRRRGIGRAFARQLLARSPGPWKLHHLANNNAAAIAFWRGVLDRFVPFTEAPLAHPDGLPRIEQRFVVC